MELPLHSFYFLNEVTKKILGQEGQGCIFENERKLNQLFSRKKKFIHQISSKTVAAATKLLQSCLTLCDPIDGSPPGFPVPGILQARTLEWVAISFSK